MPNQTAPEGSTVLMERQAQALETIATQLTAIKSELFQLRNLFGIWSQRR